MEEQSVRFVAGGLRLEGVLAIPEGAGRFPAVIVCHPHSLYGGSMNNNVVCTVTQSLTQASFVSLRFNFRGVGGSQGSFAHGTGEREDASAAISFLSTFREVDSARIGIAGYSAGAAFGLPEGAGDGRVKALAAISPPLAMFDFGFLRTCPKPKLLISGSKDDFTPNEPFLAFCCSLPQPIDYYSIEGADHFWWGYEDSLTARVTEFFTRVLRSQSRYRE